MKAMLLIAICICGLACLFALAVPSAEASEKPEPVILQANAHSPSVVLAVSAIFRQKSIDYNLESATSFARGLNEQPELSPPYNRSITLHNKDEPVLRE